MGGLEALGAVADAVAPGVIGLGHGGVVVPPVEVGVVGQFRHVGGAEGLDDGVVLRLPVGSAIGVARPRFAGQVIGLHHVPDLPAVPLLDEVHGHLAGDPHGLARNGLLADAVPQALGGLTIAGQFHQAGGDGVYRFLSGVTPKGLITFTNTVKNLADDITVIRDESGITEKLLADIADYSASIGYDVIVCRDVLFPEKTAHVLIPEKRLAYVTSCDAFPINIKGAKHISADKYCDKNILSKYDSELCFYKENIKTLLLKCVDILKEAKNIHDELEDCYISEMDFGALDRLTDGLIKEMLG